MTVSKTFCMMPWVHMHMWPDGSVYPCCVGRSDMPVGNTNSSSLLEIWNDDGMRRLRRNMLSGTESPECNRCYQIESAGMSSLRLQSINDYGLRHMAMVDGTSPDGAVESINMAYLDIRWSNLCNLRCRTCGPDLSSAWYDDQIVRVPGYKKPRIMSVNAGVWEQLVPYLSQTEEVYFAGGESILTEEHYRLLDHWISIGKTDVRLRYTTNFTVLDYKKRDIFELWRRFDDVAVAASIDGSHGRGEYLRKNMIWEDVVRNRRRMLDEVPNIYFELTPTVSLFNVWHLPDFHREWVELGLLGANNVRINLLTYPPHTSCRALPARLKDAARGKILEHIEWLRGMRSGVDTDRWTSIVNFMDAEDDSHLLAEFKSYHGEIDGIRGEDLMSVFPELGGLYDGI